MGPTWALGTRAVGGGEVLKTRRDRDSTQLSCPCSWGSETAWKVLWAAPV